MNLNLIDSIPEEEHDNEVVSINTPRKQSVLSKAISEEEIALSVHEIKEEAYNVSKILMENSKNKNSIIQNQTPKLSLKQARMPI